MTAQRTLADPGEQSKAAAYLADPGCPCHRAPGPHDADGGIAKLALGTPPSVGSTFSRIVGDQGSGAPLPSVERRSMETRFGHSFADVRVHTDGRAAQAAGLIDAYAFTVGNHIFWNSSAGSVAGHDGRRTLAHELVHVLQQRQAPMDSMAVTGVEVVDDGGSELEAASVAADVMRRDGPSADLDAPRTSFSDPVTTIGAEHNAGIHATGRAPQFRPIAVKHPPRAAQARRQPGEGFTDCVNRELSSAGIAAYITTLIWVTCGIIGGIGALGGSLVGPGGTLTGLGLALAGCLALGTGFPIGVIIGALKVCGED